MKTATRSSRIVDLSCCVPCQSMSVMMSLAGGQRRLDRRARRAVAMAEDGRMLQELAPVHHRVEALLRDEMIVLALDLAWRARPRRHGDGDFEPGIAGRRARA